MNSISGWIALLALLLAVAPAGAQDKVAADVRQALASAGQVRVVALLADAQVLAADRVALADRVDRLLRHLPSEVRIERRFHSVPALALTVDADGLAALVQSPDVATVSLDPGGTGQLLQSVPLARIDDVQALGFSGLGRKVAVIDSGLRLDHHSFSGRIVDQACFCFNCCPNAGATQFGPGAAADDHGHGTNVSGIAAGGSGVATVPAGAAFESQIVAIKALNSGNAFCCISDIVGSLDWLLVNHPDTAAVNLSLGTFQRFPGHCDGSEAWTVALAAVINGLTAQGTSVTVSSGNNGSSNDIQAPACIQNALAVAAVWDSNVGAASTLGCTDATTAADKMTCFSNLSPVVDLAAPGAFVTAAGRNSPTATSTFAGTSMAAPMVAGCLGQLRHAFPGLSRAQVEQAVLASPVRVLRPPMVQDYPRLDCLDAFLRLDRVFQNGFQ